MMTSQLRMNSKVLNMEKGFPQRYLWLSSYCLTPLLLPLLSPWFPCPSWNMQHKPGSELTVPVSPKYLAQSSAWLPPCMQQSSNVTLLAELWGCSMPESSVPTTTLHADPAQFFLIVLFTSWLVTCLLYLCPLELKFHEKEATSVLHCSLVSWTVSGPWEITCKYFLTESIYICIKFQLTECTSD